MWAVEISVCFLLRQLASGTTGSSAQLVAAAREIATVCVFQYLPGLYENQGIKDAALPRWPHQSSLAVCGNSCQCETASESRLNGQKHCDKRSETVFGSAAVRFGERGAQSKQLSVAWCQVVWISAMIFLWNNTVLFSCFEMTDPFLFSATNIYIAAMALAQRGWLKS